MALTKPRLSQITGTLSLTSLINGGTAGQPLLAGASNPAYGALDLSGTAVTGILAAARHPALTGDVTSVAGSLTTTLATVTTAGTSTKVTYNAKGLVTSGTSLVAADIPTLTASKISDFDTQVRTSRLDQFAAPTANFSAGGFLVTNVATPVSPTDAANKAYVDASRAGLSAKDAVRAATTANITLSGTQTIDGVVLVANDRVLVKNQTTASENGIYVVSAGAWSRSTDTLTSGAFVFVTEGTTQDNQGWVLTTNNPITLGTTSLAWSQFSSSAAYTAGNGINIAGGVISAVGTTNRISVGAGGIDISSAYVGQTSITTLGTITSGTWNGTTIAVANGGTGVTSSTGTGSVVLSASPTFTGTPLSTTAATGTNTTQIATTAFVRAEILNRIVTNAALTGTIDGTNATFTLPSTPNPASSLILTLNGVVLTAASGNDFVLSGNSVVFEPGQIPQVSDRISAVFYTI